MFDILKYFCIVEIYFFKTHCKVSIITIYITHENPHPSIMFQSLLYDMCVNEETLLWGCTCVVIQEMILSVVKYGEEDEFERCTLREAVEGEMIFHSLLQLVVEYNA